MRVRQFKEEFDQFSIRERESVKLKEIADNTGSTLASLMRKGKFDTHKTPYGTVILADDGGVSLSNHSAKFAAPKKKVKK